MFIKHIGKHGDRKVVIVFREVPGEEHMALVIYPEVLQSAFQDAIMKTLESQTGQDAETFGDVMFRSLLPDGRQMLQTLHKEGMIKKVQTNQIIVTPNTASHVRLDELNRAINEMKTGEEAKKRMADIDANAGLVDPRSPAALANSFVDSSVLDDSTIAKQRIHQAEKMRADAAVLVAESERLTSEAYQLDPSLKPKAKVVRKPRIAKVESSPAEQTTSPSI